MRRRNFIRLLGGVVVAWPLAARAQQPAKLPTIGFLGSGTPTTAGAWVVAVAHRLRELGWTEDRTIKIDLRWAEGRNERSAEIATDFVRLKVDVIVTYSTEHVHIAKQATSTIPIVFATAGDLSALVWSPAWPIQAAISLENRTAKARQIPPTPARSRLTGRNHRRR